MPSNPRKVDELLARNKTTDLNMAMLLGEFHAIDAILGAEYEVHDSKNKLIARIKRKPIAPEQLQELMSLLEKIVNVKYGKKK